MELIPIDGHWLPSVFAYLMALCIALYMVLDGYDLGIGILLPFAKNNKDKSAMISAMGPYWDANETWLVLGLGLLLIAFPLAHGIVLSSLYIPIFVLIMGIILRGVSYEFRNHCQEHYLGTWNFLFFLGSLLMAFSQGFILAIFCFGLEYTSISMQAGFLSGLIISAIYAFNGAAWLIIKSEKDVYIRSLQLGIGFLRISSTLTFLTV